MIIACASEYSRLACVEVTPTYWSGSLCQRASCKRGLARFSWHGLARLGSVRHRARVNGVLDTELVWSGSLNNNVPDHSN